MQSRVPGGVDTGCARPRAWVVGAPRPPPLRPVHRPTPQAPTLAYPSRRGGGWTNLFPELVTFEDVDVDMGFRYEEWKRPDRPRKALHGRDDKALWKRRGASKDSPGPGSVGLEGLAAAPSSVGRPRSPSRVFRVDWRPGRACMDRPLRSFLVCFVSFSRYFFNSSY